MYFTRIFLLFRFTSSLHGLLASGFCKNKKENAYYRPLSRFTPTPVNWVLNNRHSTVIVMCLCGGARAK